MHWQERQQDNVIRFGDYICLQNRSTKVLAHLTSFDIAACRSAFLPSLNSEIQVEFPKASMGFSSIAHSFPEEVQLETVRGFLASDGLITHECLLRLELEPPVTLETSGMKEKGLLEADLLPSDVSMSLFEILPSLRFSAQKELRVYS